MSPELEKAFEELRKDSIDAARYRFLRDRAFLQSPDCRSDFSRLADCHGDDFDDIVNQEMAKEDAAEISLTERGRKP